MMTGSRREIFAMTRFLQYLARELKLVYSMRLCLIEIQLNIDICLQDMIYETDIAINFYLRRNQSNTSYAVK